MSKLAATLPDAERFGLIATLRRVSISIASQIAHGCGRGVTPEYHWHLEQARGEQDQLDTQLLFVKDFGYITESDYAGIKSQLDECERVLAGLIRSLGG